jgi:predicted CoA-binding protein
MTHTNDPEVIRKILESYRTIAVVGLSPTVGRASNGVARLLQNGGFKLIPVNPKEEEILGEKSYPDLRSIPEDAGVEVVQIFRRSEHVPPIVDEAIEIGAKAVWMQDGVVHEEAAEKAKKAGLEVVMNDCMGRQFGRLSA